MNVILCGQLMNAFTGRVNRHFEPERWFPREGGDYYASLFRHTDQSYFERAATLVTIAEYTVFGSVDWAMPGDASEVPYGVTHQVYGDDAYNDAVRADSRALAELLLAEGAFSSESLECLQRGGTEPEAARSASDAHKYAELQLINIIEATVMAGDGDAMLAVSVAEEKIIREIFAFILNRQLSLAFAFPDMGSIKFLDEETLPAALVNFAPPDPSYIATIRADKLVRRYSAAVSKALADKSELDRKRKLVHAMREAVAEEGRISGAQTVIEIATAFANGVQFPGVGLALGLMGHKLKKERADRSWHLIRPRMSDVSVREYLRRNGNL